MRFALAAIAALIALPLHAACPDAAAVDALVADMAAGTPAAAPVPAGSSLEDAYCAQDMMIERLTPEFGEIVGWKAGLTSGPAQKAFGVTEPVLGALLANMLLQDGATVKVGAAARPLFEADLIVEIADAGVMDATTPEEVMAHVAGVRPFMELPDLMLSTDEKMDGAVITAINVGARAGVMGDLIALPAGAEGAEMLATMTARLTDGAGAELSAAPGSAALGHPLQAVIWVADALKRRGRTLEAGDLVSIGSLGPLHPMKPGMTATLTYIGLPGDPSISASFE